MALNHILFRPQVLERPISPSERRVGEELLEMISRLVADGIKDGRARQKLEAGLKEAMDALVQEVKSRIATASASFQALLAPIIAAFEGIGAGLGNMQSPGDGINTIASLILLLADLLEGLSADAIEAKLNELMRIITVDLGLSRERMTAFLNQAADIVADKMKEDFLQGDHGEQAHNEYLIGCYIEKMKRLAADELSKVTLDFDIASISAQISGYLRNLDWDNVRLAAKQMIEDAGNLVRSLGILFDIFSGKFTVTVEVNSNLKVGGPGDPVSWYATYFDRKFIHDIPVGVVDRERLEDEDFFTKMSFKKSWLPPNTMEELAHWSDVCVSAFQIAMHLRSVQTRDWVGNMSNSVTQLIKGIITAALGYNKDEDWVTAYKVIGNNYFDIGMTLVTALLTGIESHHPFKGEDQWKFYWTLVGKDFVESMLYKNWGARARQGLLSLFTLLNADPIGKPTSENQHKVEGFSMLIAEIFSWILATPSGRSHFGLPAHGKPGAFIGFYLLGWLGSYIGAIAGWFISWGITHSQLPDNSDSELSRPNDESFGWLSLEALVSGLLKYPIYNYLIWNGATDKGHFGKDAGDFTVTPAVQPKFQTFKGYPPKESSPYKMPYAQGQIKQCAQGNNGVWSHNQNTNQIYAYDWDHDHRADVLSVREGIITGFSDAMPDHNNDLDNNVTVTHSLTPPDPVHDRDWTDHPVLTRANYIHGAHFSTRHIFAAKGIPENEIVGSRITQGELLMLSGDTGMSAYNHLHMHISSAKARSLPWVFRDAPDNGVLKDLIWYESGNTQAPDPVGLSIAHPEEQKSLGNYIDVSVVSTSSPNTVRLDFSTAFLFAHGSGLSSSVENIFKNCTLLWVEPSGKKQYHHILESKEDEASEKIDLKLLDNWNPAPPPATYAMVGGVNTPTYHAQVSILARALHATSDTIRLDGLARFQSDTYAGRNILVWWTAENGDTIYQYKQIESYIPGNQRVKIVGTWDVRPEKFAEYAIGGKTYPDSSTFYRRFSFITESGAPTVTPIKTLHNIVPSYIGHRARVAGMPANNKLTLRPSAPTVLTEVENHFIAIYDGNPAFGNTKVIAYDEITTYLPGTREITIAGTWPFTISSISHYYEIGAMKHAVATAEDLTKIPFLCPDSGAGYTPTDFIDGIVGPPYQSLTYKTW